MIAIVCKSNGRVLPYIEVVGIPDGFDLIEIDDVKGQEAIEQGLCYIDGEFKPPVVNLEEIKAELKGLAYAAFVKQRDAITWTELYGYDRLPEDIINFNSAFKIAEMTGKAPYRVYIKETGEKKMVDHTPEMFKAAMILSAVEQRNAYFAFDNTRAEIDKAITLEELNLIKERLKGANE